MNMLMRCLFVMLLILSVSVLGQMTVRDSDTNLLMQVNDEGNTGSVSLPQGSTPTVTSMKLYNVGGTLYWNGTALELAGTANGWTDDGAVVRLTAATDKVGIGLTTPGFALDVKDSLGISGTRTLYVPDQAVFTNSLIVGNGGTHLTRTTGDEGRNNTAAGLDALAANTTGAFNTGVGYGALKANTSGDWNTAVGNGALIASTTGDQNTAVGNGALFSSTTASGNTATGHGALFSNTSGMDNTANGLNTLLLNTDGHSNTAAGANALRSNTTGDRNTAVGDSALYTNSGGLDNTAVGYRALLNSISEDQNVAVGSHALENAGSGWNTACGYAALENNTYNSNTAVGCFALQNNTNGIFNTAVGVSAMRNGPAGEGNTACGYFALADNDGGGSHITAIGSSTGVKEGYGPVSNATAIGYGAEVDASNKVRVGNDNVTVIEGKVAFTASSDSTKKENLLKADGEDILEKISTMWLGSWNFKGPDNLNFRHYGPMAQTFYRAFGHDGVGTCGTDTTICASDIDGINMIAIQALEKRTAENASLRSEVDQLKDELKELKAVVAELSGETEDEKIR